MANVVHPVAFSILEHKFAVVKLPSDAPTPELPVEDEFFSVTRTRDELSIVCREELAPSGGEIERNWRCIKVQGPLEFSLMGVLLGLLEPLAVAGIGVFAVSTYDTDHIFVKQYHLETAIVALEQAGHRLVPAE